MRKRQVLAALAVCACLLLLAESAQAQMFGRFYGRGRGGVYINTPYFSYGYGPYYGGWYAGYYYPSYSWWYTAPYSYGWTYYYPSTLYPYGYTYGPTYSGSYTYSSGYESSPNRMRYADYTRAQGDQFTGAYPGTNQVLLHVSLPDPNAQVWIDDHATQQRGRERDYLSPSLDPNRSYSYTVRARWTENGQEVTREKTVTFQPGRTVTVNFTTGGDTTKPASGEPDRPRPSTEQPDLRRPTEERTRPPAGREEPNPNRPENQKP
jgi:uncharacterized protein (TIGR03000 family)